jgi:hypothetical protein
VVTARGAKCMCAYTHISRLVIDDSSMWLVATLSVSQHQAAPPRRSTH